MTPEDLFRLQTVTEVALSPRGRSVAYVVQRPISATSNFGRLYLWGNDRADVFVQISSESKPQNITQGCSDGSGFWKPVWSPDGERLAMLSTRGGDIRVWTWNKISGQLQLVSERGVSPWPFVGNPGESENFLWVSDHVLLFWVLPPGQKSSRLMIDANTPATAEKEWAKARNGRETTVSVLESAEPSLPVSTPPRSELLLADVLSGKIERLSMGAGYGDYDFATLRLAPDRRSVAFLRQVDVWRPERDRPVTQLINPVYEVVLADLTTRQEIHVLTGVREPFPGSLLWSPDGAEIAVTGYDGAMPFKEEIFRCRASDGTCRRAGPSLKLDLHARNVVQTPPYVWIDRHELAIHGLRTADPGVPDTERWWVEDRAGGATQLFAIHQNEQGVLTQLIRDPRGHGLLGIIGGHVWRFQKDGIAAKNLTLGLDTKIRFIQQPQGVEYGIAQNVVLLARGSEGDDYYLLDLHSDEVSALSKPTAGARLAGFDQIGSTFAFVADNESGTFLYVRHGDWPGAARQTLLEANRFLGGIQAGNLKRIEYRSLDGKDLMAWVILPYGYTEGSHYPAVAWVQPGTIYGAEPPEPPYALDTINNCHPLNLQLLAAHGYAVLMPSMPLEAYGEAHSPYAELMNGVLPAIDQLVNIGIADPQRLGVFGQSIGGYAVYGLVTQTTRFRAAVASAGFSDLLSLYGTFDVRSRYDPSAHEDTFRMWSAETGGMALPPWSRLEHYFLNSPLSYADRVQTPLLIIQGDLDYVPIQQGEEFFTALYRQHKRGRFVRYWGEDHLLTSPANIQDMWQRIYAWFDELLVPPRL